MANGGGADKHGRDRVCGKGICGKKNLKEEEIGMSWHDSSVQLSGILSSAAARERAEQSDGPQRRRRRHNRHHHAV